MEGLNLRRNAGAAAVVTILIVAALSGGLYTEKGRLVVDPVNSVETLSGIGNSAPQLGVDLGGLPSTAPELSPGNSTNVSGVRVTLERVETSIDVASVNGSSFDVVSPPEGAKSLILVVSAENVGKTQTALPSGLGNGSDFYVRYAGKAMETPPGGPVIEGEQVRFNEETFQPYAVAPGETVYPGVVRRGCLVYTVPEGMDLRNGTFGVTFRGEKAEWRLADGQESG